jgi:hypothetical protein
MRDLHGSYDFDRAALSWARETTITHAEQNRHKALNVVAYHQIIGSPNGNIEMTNRYKTKKTPRRRVTLDDFVNSAERQMQ